MYTAGQRQHGLLSQMDSICFHNYTLAVVKNANASLGFSGEDSELKQTKKITLKDLAVSTRFAVQEEEIKIKT